MKSGGQKGKILSYGREILRLEAQAISELEHALDQNFERAVCMLAERPAGSRLVVSGIGKTGFIGMKISATFASIGIPSFFLHPAEAAHGDLGRYSKEDIALFLSNSGETPEILRVIPQIKRIGCRLIAFTADPGSTLARHSDVTICVGKVEEAGPLGLAPTTSTAVMLALGDALAMTALNQTEFSKEQYAFFHPGGALGAALTPVSSIMRSGEEHCIVKESTRTRDVLHSISTTPRRPGAASVVSPQGALVGIFTDGDLRRCLDQNSSFLDLEIRDVMGRNPKRISSDKLAPEALRVMSEHKIDQLIVVDGEDRPIGMVDIQDLVAIGVR
ncbi:MAG: KpsF/GutQ family sugar-phosphate isomerase [Oligoflexia bacterium]|nr:KpsF/GutQ family sugar-phosphate isomerase [Oligoflexia bacterium]